MALDNKSLVSSANYLTDLNSTYSKAIVLYKNNVLIPNGINHTIEATVSYFDKVELIDKQLLLKAPVVIDSNTSMLAELANIVSEISAHIDDSIILNSSAINGTDLLIDISVSTDSTILRTLNIKVKYGSILKYDLDSTSNEYIQILTNAGTINNEIFTAIIDIYNQVIPNIEEILLVDDKASEVSSNTLLVSSIKDDIIAMRDETIVNRDSSLQSSINSENSATSSEESNQSSMNARDTILAIELQSETFAENALNSSIASAASADIATDKANISIAQAIIATNKASEALTSANNASDSEDNALSYKNNAEQFANDSSDSATISEEQAIISSAKASEALASANNAEISEQNALSSELIAEKWANEEEDVVVSDGKYSAKHYMLKSEDYANIALGMIDDNASSIVTTYSSNKIETDLNVIGFDISADVSVGPGQVAWNATEGTYDMGLENGSVLQAGQENIRKVTNNSGALISNGTLVMYNGTNGASGRINVKPFTAGFNEAIKLYGVATQSIENGSDGIITIEGKVRGLDTTGASVGEVWVDNDILYAKPNDNGMMTKIEPADNELKIVVASVIKAHHTNGTLEIRFMPFNENAYYTKVQNDILLDNKVPLNDGFTLDLGEL